MSLNLKNVVGNIFYNNKDQSVAEEQNSADLKQTVDNVFGNPFLNKNGELINPHLNYQKLLDNPNVSNKVKQYIEQATGLSSTTTTSTSTGQPATTTATPATATDNSTGTPAQKKVGTSNSNLVNAAQKYIGTPYVWGGESMSEGGMDCSGFVYNALKDAGYDVGRTTAQGYRGKGTKVSKSDLQPGDLIFYGSGNATHIGIYIGNGQMIHSSGNDNNTKSNPGKGVEVKNIDYRRDFLEARRY